MKSTSRNKDVVMAAMELARMTGIMETLGNLPDGFFQEHKGDLLCMAEEFVRQQGKDLVVFFEKKIAALNQK
mgnify:FL=1